MGKQSHPPQPGGEVRSGIRTFGRNGGKDGRGRPAPLFAVSARLFAEAFPSQCLLDAELLPRLQVERVSLDFLDDVFLQNFPFKSAERVLQRLAFLKPYFSQIYVSAFELAILSLRTSLRGERPNIQWGAKNRADLRGNGEELRGNAKSPRRPLQGKRSPRVYRGRCSR
jgi:hypothetical protein